MGGFIIIQIYHHANYILFYGYISIYPYIYIYIYILSDYRNFFVRLDQVPKKKSKEWKLKDRNKAMTADKRGGIFIHQDDQVLCKPHALLASA
jgi:hypothetical protein